MNVRMKSKRRSRARQAGSVKGVLIFLGIVGAVIGLAVMGAMWGWNQVVNFPADAKSEVVVRDHSELISRINVVVTAESSLLQAAAALEKTDLPGDVLYLAIVTEKEKSLDEDDITEIVKRLSWSGYSRTILGGTGYAELHDGGTTHHVLVIKQDIENKAVGDYWIAYLPRAMPVAEQTAAN